MQRRRDEDDKEKTSIANNNTGTAPKKRKTGAKNQAKKNAKSLKEQELARQKKNEKSKQDRKEINDECHRLESLLKKFIQNNKVICQETELNNLPAVTNFKLNNLPAEANFKLDDLPDAVATYKALESSLNAFIATLKPDSTDYNDYVAKKKSIESNLAKVPALLELIEILLSPYNENKTLYLPTTGDVLPMQEASIAREKIANIRKGMRESANTTNPIENKKSSEIPTNQHFIMFPRQKVEPLPPIKEVLGDLLKYQPK